MSKSEDGDRRKAERKTIQADVEFILYLDAYKATSVDISENGIRFDTEKPIIIEMQANVEGQKLKRNAQLVWAKKNPEGGISYGFEFIPDID